MTPRFLLWKILIVAALADKTLARWGMGHSRAKPSLSLGFNTDKTAHSTLGGLEPSLSWQDSISLGEYNIEGGAKVKVKELDSIPHCSIWSKVKRKIRGFALSGRGDVDLDIPDKVTLDLGCVTPVGTKLQIKGAVDRGDVSVGSVKLTQTLTNVGGGDVILIPSYNVGKSKGELTLAYGTDKTIVQMDANTNKDARLTVTYKIEEGMEISPCITTAGDLSVDYKKSINQGSVTVTVKPKSFVNVKWADGPWQANFCAPMDGYRFNEGVKVSVSTKVDIDTPWGDC